MKIYFVSFKVLDPIWLPMITLLQELAGLHPFSFMLAKQFLDLHIVSFGKPKNILSLTYVGIYLNMCHVSATHPLLDIHFLCDIR